MSSGIKTREWKVSRAFKSIGSGTTPKSGTSEYYDEGSINWLITGDLNDGEITATSKKITPKAVSDYSTLKTYPANSLVIAMYGATIAKVGLLKIPTTVNQACCVLVPSKRIDPRYAYYYFLSSKRKLIDLGSGGGQPNISQDVVRSFKITLPEKSEQKKMVNYLDTKTQTLDKILTAKNHTHTHLSELRQAIITNAVRTGGAIMNAPKVRLKSIAKIYNGATPKSDNLEYWNGDIAWATPVDMSKLSGKFIKSTQRTITQAGYASCNTTLLQPGNIVISNRAPIGLVAINDVPLCTNQGCKAMKIDSTKIDVVYLYYVLSSMTDDLNNLGTGTTFMEISSESLKNIEIPLPTLGEQRKIAEVLDAKIANLDNADSKLSASVKLLEEYRSSLISNVVGGKVEI